MPYKNIVIKPAKIANADSVKKSQFYRGFSTVFNVKNTKVYDKELVKQDLINIFNTKRGERVMNPEFGTIIWDCIFDQLTDSLKEEIKEDIERILTSDPRLSPMSVNIIEKDYGLLLEITVMHVETNQTDFMTLSFDRSIGLVVQ